MVEGTPPGDALPPPPQRARQACKGARCGAGAGSPRPHRPHPGHTGRRSPAARPRGRAAGRGTAPDTSPRARTDRTRDRRVAEPGPPAPEDRRPGEGQRMTPDAPHNGGRPPLPRHVAPTGHAGQGDSVGPPHPQTRAHSTWVADPDSPPSGRAVGGGTAPDLRRPSQWWKAPPLGDALPPPP